MKYIVSILILALVGVLTSASCKKTSSTETDNGFACKIDGKVWRPYSNDFKLREAECQVSQRGESVFIKVVNTKTFEHFSILVNSPGKVVTKGKYALNSNRYFIGLYDDRAGSGEFITGNGYEGEIEIANIDKTNSRISGKFYFNAYNSNTKQSIEVTEGNFNLRFDVY